MVAKLSPEKVNSVIEEILAKSVSNKRKFNESFELQVGLKNYDPKKDKRFSGTIALPFIPKYKKKVAILGDSSHIAQATNLGVDSYSSDDLKKFNKQKKIIKKFAKKYDFFLASESLIKLIPRILGPGLNKAGKFPTLLLASDNILDKIDRIKATIKLELKKSLCLGVLVGNCEMKISEILQNTLVSINFLVSLLKKNWQNVGSLHLKSTMGKPIRIF
jgi:large subunit ribosomal protein L10Ae